jgi:peptide/nickel transport system substrate-binding protein
MLMVIVMIALAACSGGANNTPPASSGESSSSTGDSSPAAETPAAPDDGPQYGGVFRIAVTAEGGAPIGVPWENTTNDTLYMVSTVESLVQEATNGDIRPWLADSWDLDLDNNEYVFQLHEGIKFWDGSDFNAEVAAWNLTNCIEAGQLQGVNTAEARDTYTLVLHFENFQNQILSRLASRTTGFISKESFDKNGLEWARENPVMTGPFKFESWTRGEKLVLVKNENYWIEGEPYLDGFTYMFVRDVMTQQAALQSSGDQSIDVLGTTSGEQAATLRDLGFIVESFGIGPLVLVPSSKDASSPLANPDVRRAIAWAIDRDSISAARGFGILTPAYQLTDPAAVGYLPASENFGYDVAKAKQYLADAGYPDGFTTKLIAMPGFADRDAVVIMQDQLAAIGITAELEFPDSGGYNEYRSGGWDGMLVQHFRIAANANNMLNVYLPPEAVSFVSLKRSDGVIDAIVESSKTPEVDPVAVQKVYKLMQDDAMMIPIYNVQDMYVTKDTVRDGGFAQWGGSTVWQAHSLWLAK